MNVAPLAKGFAIRIDGVDLSQPLDAERFDQIRSLWMQHRLVLFPNQALDDDRLVGFAARFGPLFVHAQTSLLSKHRKEVMTISNLPDAEKPADYELDWHSDQTYTPQPVFGTILHGLAAPHRGGETEIADLAGAYASLPQALKQRIDGVNAVYAAEPRPQMRKTPLNAEERRRIQDCTHPLVRTHPYLGRKAIYLSPLHMKSIGTLSESDSQLLVAELVLHATQPDHLYRHKWTVGDLIMWDNTSVMHRRTAQPGNERRHLKRVGFHLPENRATPS